jgi:NADPH-dependent curcumin reductase CurA
MSDYVNKKGFAITRISQQAAMETPARTVFNESGISAYESLIPETPNTATRVFFVSGANGDEYGQFATDILAIAKAREIVALPASQRVQYEQ